MPRSLLRPFAIVFLGCPQTLSFAGWMNVRWCSSKKTAPIPSMSPMPWVVQIYISYQWFLKLVNSSLRPRFTIRSWRNKATGRKQAASGVRMLHWLRGLWLGRDILVSPPRNSNDDELELSELWTWKARFRLKPDKGKFWKVPVWHSQSHIVTGIRWNLWQKWLIFFICLYWTYKALEELLRGTCSSLINSPLSFIISGMDSCGQFGKMAVRFWGHFLLDFTYTGEKLVWSCIQNLLAAIRSPAGSNRREDTIFQWEWWVVAVQEGDVNITWRHSGVCDQVWLPSTARLPAVQLNRVLWSGKEPLHPICINMQYVPETPSMSLFLPRGVTKAEDLKELMHTATKESLGFGKLWDAPVYVCVYVWKLFVTVFIT